MTFKGLYTPLITPFLNDTLDEEGLGINIKRQEEAGVAGLVILGTTAETPTLLKEEKARILEIASESSLPQIVVCTHPSTQGLVEMVKNSKGHDALMISAPVYNKPTQEGLYQHFAAAAKATDLPIILYNIPSRTSINIDPTTIARLAKIDNIVAIKECNVDQVAQVLDIDIDVLSGEDSAILSMMAMGAKGAVAATANIVPHQLQALVQACLEHDFQNARKIHSMLMPLFRAASWETNPIPCKAAMDILGYPAGSPRLPLLPCTKRTELEEVLCKLGS